MFYEATAFNGNLASWNTDKVTYMQNMFRSATAFNGNLASWNTDKVMSHVCLCYIINQNVCNWLDNTNFPDAIDTAYMFYGSGCDVTSDPSISGVCQFCPS